MRKHSFFFAALVTLILVLVTGDGLCQPQYEWVKYYGAPHALDWFRDVFATHEGGYAMTGSRNLAYGTFAIWLVVADSTGEAFIDKTYMPEDSSADQEGRSIIQTDDGGYVIGGRISSQINPYIKEDFMVMKVDSAGDQIWQGKYARRDGGECYAVIELKNGNIVACGREAPGDQVHYPVAHAAMLSSDGEEIWTKNYDGIELHAVREVDDGLVFSGWADTTGWLLKTDNDGEVLWSQTYPDFQCIVALVTCPDGGFAGADEVDYDIIKTDAEGNEEWSKNFDQAWYRYCWGLARLWDGSFMLVGSDQEHGGLTGHVMLLDPQGELQWEQNDTVLPDHARSTVYWSVIENNRYYPIVAGSARADGVLIKVLPETSPPVILDTIPNTTDMTLIRGDWVSFGVVVEDAQGDSLYYYWSLDSDTISTDISVTITFNDLGEHLLQLWVSDGQFQDSCFWTIHVKEIMVTGYEPQELRMTLLRDSEVPFKASCRAAPGDAVDLTWKLDNDVVSQVDSALIQFSKSGNRVVKYQASTGEYADTVRWNVTVNSVMVTGYEPDSLVLSLRRHAVIPFKIVATASPGDTITYRWYWVETNETIATADSATVQFEVPGRWQLRGEARCGEDRAWQTWAVEVRSIIYDWLPIATTLAPSQDTTVTFTIVPSDTSSDSLKYLWTLDGDSAGSDISATLFLTAPERHTIKGYLWDGAEMDSVVWEAYPPQGISDFGFQILDFGLSEPYPNPFNQSSVVSYQLSVAGKVNLSLYDIGGRLVERLVDGWQGAGEHRVIIGGQAGMPAPPALPTGIYFVRLQAGREVMTRKAVVIR